MEELKSIETDVTTLNNQIGFLEGLNGIIKMPVLIAIIESLKELRSIKQKRNYEL